MMDGSAELARLAELLRLGAETGRYIATYRPDDAADIERLALSAESLASELDAIALRDPDFKRLRRGRPH